MSFLINFLRVARLLFPKRGLRYVNKQTTVYVHLRSLKSGKFLLICLPVLFTKKTQPRLHKLHLLYSALLVHLQRVCLPTHDEAVYLQKVHLPMYSCCLFTNCLFT